MLPSLPHRTSALLSALLLSLPACSGGPSPPETDAGLSPDGLPPAAALETWLQPVIDRGYVHGMAVGLIDETGSLVQGYGSLGDGGAPPRGDTLFQIGSITKTFTGLWLATQLVDGKLEASEPVQDLLQGVVEVPTFQGTAITLQDLATHTSGLPDGPTNLAPQDLLNPWADYTPEDLYAFLSAFSLPHAPGTQFLYSNTGEGLLGLALSHRAGGTYDDNIRKVVAAPLGLVDTTAVLSADQQQRAAPGYDGDLSPIEPWTFTEALAGAAELRSTVDDLLKYAAAQAGITSSPLDAAMTLSHQAIHPTSAPGFDVGLNWIVATDQSLVWHNGGVYGATAFIGFDPVKHKAAVVLVDTSTASTATTLGLDPVSSIGLLLVQWLQGTTPAPLASILPASASLTPAQLTAATGTYSLDDGGGPLELTLQGDKLQTSFASAIWPRPILLYPTSATTFVCREVPASGSFQVGADGGVTGLTVTLGGQTFHGTKQ